MTLAIIYIKGSTLGQSESKYNVPTKFASRFKAVTAMGRASGCSIAFGRGKYLKF